MKKIKEISKKTLILWMLFIFLISYIFPVVAFGVNIDWEYKSNGVTEGEYHDKKYDEIPKNDSTLNDLRGNIAHSGVLMQAYILNKLLASGKIEVSKTQTNAGADTGAGIQNNKQTIKYKIDGKDVDNNAIKKLIKEEIENQALGYPVERDYAINNIDIDSLIGMIVSVGNNPIKYGIDKTAAENFASSKRSEINPNVGKGGESAKDFADRTEQEYIQDNSEDEGGWMDSIGGILLEPVFFLVNFIADALMCMLDGIMIDGDFSVLPHVMSTQKITYTGQPNYRDTIANGIGFANYPRIRYSPEMIFSGQVPILSIDFISGNGSGTPLEQVRTTIASWYKALRLFAIIGLLSVLIYTGIKVMLSANSKDKAKYKEWILNWFLAVAILFSMHYIMSFIITVTTEVNSLLGNAVSDGVKAAITVNGTEDKFKTNLIGLCRYMVQADSFVTKIGYEVMYIALIVYTFKFTVVYLKRVLNMAFLTLIAPLVALMYPIDKMTDGSAQGFDMWLKEYIYNALLQPMHMLMYYVLVSSAIQVAGDNPIYGIVVLAFMTEAEKLLKKIFGFDKAHGGTVGGMGSAFAAGAVASQLGNIAKQLKGGNSKNGNGGKSDNGSPELPPTLKDADNVEENFAGNADDSNLEEDPESDSNGNSNSAAGAYQDSDDPVADAERERLEEMIADGQIDENELTDRERQLLGMSEEDSEDSGESANEEAADNQGSTENSTEDSSRKNRLARGAKAVGKRLAKPVWDFDKSKKYNGKRLLKNAAKGAVGFAVGSTAAAVQAGISITDGKYNPFEGVASFGAGFAGGSSIAGGAWDGAKSIKGTFDQGFHSADDKEQEKKWANKQRERYHEDWSNRDDVNKIFKDKFGEDQFKKMKEMAKTYTDRGYNDPKEVAKLMKASGSLGWDDKKTIATMNFKKQLQEQQAYGAVSDKEKEKKYIDAIIKNNNLSGDDATRVRKQYEEAFKSVAQLNKKM